MKKKLGRQLGWLENKRKKNKCLLTKQNPYLQIEKKSLTEVHVHFLCTNVQCTLYIFILYQTHKIYSLRKSLKISKHKVLSYFHKFFSNCRIWHWRSYLKWSRFTDKRIQMAGWFVEQDEPMMIKVIIKQYTNLITPYSSELWKQMIPTAGEIDIGIIKYDFSTYLYRMLM